MVGSWKTEKPGFEVSGRVQYVIEPDTNVRDQARVDGTWQPLARIDQMRHVEQSIPPDIGIEYISDQSGNVTAKIEQVLSNDIGAMAIVVIVVYLVVEFRSAMVMAANIPVVVLAAIALVTLFGVRLEQISLASIIIAPGCSLTMRCRCSISRGRTRSKACHRSKPVSKGHLSYPPRC